MLHCLCQRDRPRPQQNAGNRGYGQWKEAIIGEANSGSSQTKVARSFNQPDSTYIRNKAKLKSAAEKFWARRRRSVTPDTLCNYFRQAGLTIVGESTVETQTTY